MPYLDPELESIGSEAVEARLPGAMLIAVIRRRVSQRMEELRSTVLPPKQGRFIGLLWRWTSCADRILDRRAVGGLSAAACAVDAHLHRSFAEGRPHFELTGYRIQVSVQDSKASTLLRSQRLCGTVCCP